MKNYVRLLNYFIDLYSVTSIELVWKIKRFTFYVEHESTRYYKAYYAYHPNFTYYDLDTNPLSKEISINSIEYAFQEQTLYLQIKAGSTVIAEIEQANLLNDSQYDTDKIITTRQHAAETIAKKKIENIMQLKHEYIKSLKN